MHSIGGLLILPLLPFLLLPWVWRRYSGSILPRGARRALRIRAKMANRL